MRDKIRTLHRICLHFRHTENAQGRLVRKLSSEQCGWEIRGDWATVMRANQGIIRLSDMNPERDFYDSLEGRNQEFWMIEGH